MASVAPVPGPEPIKFLEESGLWYFTQGNVRFPVDAKSDVASVKTLDKLNRTTWMSLANFNHFPANPFNEVLIKPLLMAVVQIAWLKQFSNDQEAIARLEANQLKRIDKYNQDILKVADQKQTAKKERKEKAVKEGKVPKVRVATYYAISEKADLSKAKGQLAIILKAMINFNRPATIAEIAEKITGELTTKQPPERVVGYYMGTEKKTGLFVTVEEVDIPKESERLAAVSKAFSAGLASQKQEKQEKQNVKMANMREKSPKGKTKK